MPVPMQGDLGGAERGWLPKVPKGLRRGPELLVSAQGLPLGSGLGIGSLVGWHKGVCVLSVISRELFTHAA